MYSVDMGNGAKSYIDPVLCIQLFMGSLFRVLVSLKVRLAEFGLICLSRFGAERVDSKTKLLHKFTTIKNSYFFLLVVFCFVLF